MPSTSRKGGGISFNVYRLLFLQNGSHGFEGYTEIDVLTIRDATLDATAMVGDGSDVVARSDKDIILLRASGCDAIETFTVFETLHSVDAEHRCT